MNGSGEFPPPRRKGRKGKKGGDLLNERGYITLINGKSNDHRNKPLLISVLM